jgi:hypothetical protein
MGWEKRARGSKYYTRSRRVDGRVVREYIGKGPKAEEQAEDDQLARMVMAKQRAIVQSRLKQLDALDATIGKFSKVLDSAVHVVLKDAGYHQHHRGEWRKRRDTSSGKANQKD